MDEIIDIDATTQGKSLEFQEFAQLCNKLEKTSRRNEKISIIAKFLRGLSLEEAATATRLLSGRVFPDYDARVLEIGVKILSKVAQLRKGGQQVLLKKPITLSEVVRFLEALGSITGPSSRAKRERLLTSLFERFSGMEAEYLFRIISGEVRVGAMNGVILEALSEVAGCKIDTVRRAYMLLGDIGDLAKLALRSGCAGLQEVKLALFRPLRPMLADMAVDLKHILDEHSHGTSFEYKYDGARIQIHKDGKRVEIFSRRLSNVTDSLPDIVQLVSAKVNLDSCLLEGEAVAVGSDGKPLPFQDLMRRFRRIREVIRKVEEVPLRLYIFDILYCNGRELLDVPYAERRALLESTLPVEIVAPRVVTRSLEEAEVFLEQALKAGHEGLIAKALDSRYEVGHRGKRWLKIKPTETLDLVIIAADWGYGKHAGWLSNYHLAAWDEEAQRYEEIGRTYRGPSDAEFERYTQELLRLETSRSKYTVYVRPQIVVETAFAEIQKSPRYPSGFALRLASIKRYREDKGPEDADTITRVRELYEKKFQSKGRLM